MIEVNATGIETLVYNIKADDCQCEIIDECPDRFHGIIQIKDEDVGPVMFHKGCYLLALCDELGIDDRFSMVDPDSDTFVIAMGPGAAMLRKAFEICGIGWRRVDSPVE